MAMFDPSAVVVSINGRKISDWADGSDVINCQRVGDIGAMTMGVNGTGVFVLNKDKSGTVTLKIKQHSEDNVFLTKLATDLESNTKSFNPITLEIEDVINGDTVSGYKGYVTTPTNYVRGGGHNAHTHTLIFERLNINLQNGK